MIYLAGIDDTDTKETRGTGFHARMLATELEAAGLGHVSGISRHQNFIHPDIPYTSQNSSACLKIDSENESALKEFCRNFLLRIAPLGSDVGLCIVAEQKVSESVVKWGQDAKKIILYQKDAIKLAAQEQIYLEGLTGTNDGIIGALAGVGLRKSGNDGRLIWLKGKIELRDTTEAWYSPTALAENFGIEQIIDIEGHPWIENEPIHIHEWFRPILKNNLVTLVVEKQFNHGKYFWQIASKDYIRSHS